MDTRTDNHEPPGHFAWNRGSRYAADIDLRQSAALSARAKKTAARIAAAKAKANLRDRFQAEKKDKLLAKKQEKARRLAEGEAEAQELKARREAVDRERMERKAREKKEEREARERRKRRDEQRRQWKEDEKRRKMHLEGVAWGFDDRAGTRFGVFSEKSDGCYVSDGRISHSHQHAGDEIEEYDDIGGRIGRKWHSGSTWGVEAGGPGKDIQFEFGYQMASKRPKRLGVGK